MTTSNSKTWDEKGLSPFFLGPVEIFPGIVAKKMENAWQFSKVYPEHVDSNGNPTKVLVDWVCKGFMDTKAHRYPMGKGRAPLYSFMFGTDEKLDYISARKKIYCPLYYRAVKDTKSYKWLVQQTMEHQRIWLWDFDGYDHIKYGMSLHDVLNSPNKKMGHAFVLAMMLNSTLCWKE